MPSDGVDRSSVALPLSVLELIRRGDRDFSPAMFRALWSVREALGAAEVHLVLDLAACRAADAAHLAPEPEGTVAYGGHHPELARPSVVSRFGDDRRWQRLVHHVAPLLVSPDSVVAFDDLRSWLVANSVSHLRLFPLWRSGAWVGYCCTVATAGPLDERADVATMQAWCDVIAQCAVLHETRASRRLMVDRLESVLSVSAEPWYMTDGQLRVVYVNGPWEEVMHRRAGASVGESWADLVHPQDFPPLRQHAQSVPDGQPFSETVRLATGRGDWVRREVRALAIREAEGGRSWVGTVRRVAEVPEASSLAGWTDLTDREREVVERIVGGQRVRTIARELYLSEHTVRNHLKRIFRKLDVSSQTELIDRVRSSRR